MPRKPKLSFNIKQRFSCGVGNVLNDLFRQLFISFSIIFLMQVVGLPAADAGLALLIGQLTDAFVSPLNGYLGDYVQIPFISKKMGRRKSWHLVGTILMAVSLPLMFNRCLLCSEYKDISWLPLAYYSSILAAGSMAYNMVEINHLSIIFTAAETVQEGTALNAIRTVFSFLSGIYVYLIALGLLGQDSGDDLGPESLNQFAHLTWIATGTGIIFAIIFLIGTKEPNTTRPLRKISTLMNPSQVEGPLKASQSVYSMLFESVDDVKRKSSIIAQSLIDVLMTSTESEEGADEATDDKKEPETVIRKTSLLQRFVHALFLTDNAEDGHDSSPKEPQVSESCVETSTDHERPGIDMITQVESLDQDRKKSIMMHFIDGLVHNMQGRQPEMTVATVEGKPLEHGEGSENQSARCYGDDPECSACQDKSNETDLEEKEGIDEHSEQTVAGDNERDGDTRRNVRQRKRGMPMILEDSTEPGIFNLGYQNETIGTEIRAQADENSFDHEPCCKVGVVPDHLDVQMPTSTKTVEKRVENIDTKSRKVSFFDEKQRELKTADEEEDATDVVCNPTLNAFAIEVATLPPTMRERKASSNKKEHSPEMTGTEVDSIDVEKRKTKSRKVQSFFDEKQRELTTADEEEDAIDVVCKPAPNTIAIEVVALSPTGKDRKVSSIEEEHASERTGTEVDSIDVSCKPATAKPSEKRRTKTTKDWLTKPSVYKVAVIVTCSRLVQDAVYAYLPLYLTETLGFGKQSIAYFPLVLLVSAALGSSISDKLHTKIGSKWTYLAASLLVIGASIYCYFQTPALKQSTYAPVIMIGSGMSIMYVMALSFVTELIGEDKEKSGSVFAIIVFIGRLSSGGLFMAIQEFYPENGSASNAGDYVRHVFSMVPAILALVGSLMVLIFNSSSLCSTRKEYSPTEEPTLQMEASATSERKESYVSLE